MLPNDVLINEARNSLAIPIENTRLSTDDENGMKTATLLDIYWIFPNSHESTGIIVRLHFSRIKFYDAAQIGSYNYHLNSYECK